MEATGWICCQCAKREVGQTHLTQPSKHKKCPVSKCGHGRCDACTEKPLGYIIQEKTAASKQTKNLEVLAKGRVKEESPASKEIGNSEGSAREGVKDRLGGDAKDGDAKEGVMKKLEGYMDQLHRLLAGDGGKDGEKDGVEGNTNATGQR